MVKIGNAVLFEHLVVVGYEEFRLMDLKFVNEICCQVETNLLHVAYTINAYQLLRNTLLLLFLLSKDNTCGFHDHGHVT